MLPDVQDQDSEHGNDKVDDCCEEHHVETLDVLFVEGDAAPGGLLKLLSLVDEIVDLGEHGPGRCGDETDQPDLEDHLLSLARSGVGER